MKKVILMGILGLGSISLFTSCQESSNKGEDNHVTDATKNVAALKITPYAASPEFADATLKVSNVTAKPKGDDSVTLTFQYDIKNYELKSQTSDAAGKNCNNSKEGQHIHFILDNQPYIALYEPKHEVTVAKNSKHYVMSFLSRSYHESLKNKEAGELYYFEIDANGKIKKLTTPSNPMVFYSRPKGDYLGDDTENVLLDFYVYNGKLAENGLQVEASINGNNFTINKWEPYFIQNAPMGKMNVSLTLKDGNGNTIEGDNTQVKREVTLAKEEPMR